MTREHLVIDSPIGPLMLVAEGTALVAIEFGETAPPAQDSDGGSALLRAAQEQLQEYFAGRRRHFDLPLALRGTDFQRQVWSALRSIPWGSTRSYGDIARAIGRPRAVRAVGAANGANPLPIVLPCHRVIGAGGALTGYAGGLARKRRLLALEGCFPA